MILLALAQTAAILGISSINTQRTAITFIHSLPSTTQLPRGETLFHLPLSYILEIFRLFSNNPKIVKDFSTCEFVLAANHQQPGNIQRLSGQQPAKAINSSNQQQQPAKAISSSNQQQPSAAAISSSHQQQQSTAATSKNDHQQQSTSILPAAPTQSTPTFVSYHYGS